MPNPGPDPADAEHFQQRWRWSLGSAQLALYGNFLGNRMMSFKQKMGVLAGV